MRYLIVVFITLYSHAGVLDFNYLNQAKSAYEQGDYKSASQNWAKVQSDEAKYDQANALYKQKKYKEALELYKTINDKKLAFEKLHNMGNAQAQLGKTDEAIKSYEEALKIKEDKDTKFNLDLLKKQKKQNKKDKKNNKDNKEQKDKKNNKDNKDQKDKKQNKDNKDQKDKKQNKDNKEQKNNQDKKNQEQNKKQEKEKQKEKEKKEAQKQKEQEQKKKKEQEKKKEEQKSASKAKDKQDNPPISNMEERKWQRKLDQKGVNTLLLPIRKGEKEDETTPW